MPFLIEAHNDMKHTTTRDLLSSITIILLVFTFVLLLSFIVMDELNAQSLLVYGPLVYSSIRLSDYLYCELPKLKLLGWLIGLIPVINILAFIVVYSYKYLVKCLKSSDRNTHNTLEKQDLNAKTQSSLQEREKSLRKHKKDKGVSLLKKLGVEFNSAELFEFALKHNQARDYFLNVNHYEFSEAATGQSVFAKHIISSNKFIEKHDNGTEIFRREIINFINRSQYSAKEIKSVLWNIYEIATFKNKHLGSFNGILDNEDCLVLHAFNSYIDCMPKEQRDSNQLTSLEKCLTECKKIGCDLLVPKLQEGISRLKGTGNNDFKKKSRGNLFEYALNNDEIMDFFLSDNSYKVLSPDRGDKVPAVHISSLIKYSDKDSGNCQVIENELTKFIETVGYSEYEFRSVLHTIYRMADLQKYTCFSKMLKAKGRVIFAVSDYLRNIERNKDKASLILNMQYYIPRYDDLGLGELSKEMENSIHTLKKD